ncbi:MAG: DUF934 domain-containing protein [Pseudomonadota bacterium]
MPQIILNGKITESPFTPVDGVDVDLQAGNLLLPLKVWQENRGQLAGRNDIGIWLDADEAVEEIADCVNEFPVIALRFPTFFDGRSLSSANILRRKYGFTGELRAIGDVRRDQVDQMQRCGFTAFQPGDSQDPENVLLGLTGFTYAYQTAVDRPGPLFRLRSP